MAEFANPEGYEYWMGRWSARLAPAFVTFAELPEGGPFLDVGSGTGALAAAILGGGPDASVVGIEPAESYVAYCRERWCNDRARLKWGDALAIPFEDESFDGTLSLLILQELPDAAIALREMCRVTKSGGLRGSLPMGFRRRVAKMLSHFWDAVLETIDTKAAREAAEECMVVRFPDEAALQRLWGSVGLREIRTRRLEIVMNFASFDDYWEPFLSGVTPTSSFVPGLNEDARESVKDSLRQKLMGTTDDDRPIDLFAKAWVVRGKISRVSGKMGKWTRS